jgi:hypothetical protein
MLSLFLFLLFFHLFLIFLFVALVKTFYSLFDLVYNLSLKIIVKLNIFGKFLIHFLIYHLNPVQRYDLLFNISIFVDHEGHTIRVIKIYNILLFIPSKIGVEEG